MTVYNHGIEQLRGAPVEWKPLTPTFGRPNAVGVAKNAPNPHAALLFAEFMLSSEGQEPIKARKRVPWSRLVNSPLNNFAYQSINPAVVLDEGKKWEPIWSELFIKGRSAQ